MTVRRRGLRLFKGACIIIITTFRSFLFFSHLYLKAVNTYYFRCLIFLFLFLRSTFTAIDVNSNDDPTESAEPFRSSICFSFIIAVHVRYT